jgi:hypothetical protein
LLVLYFCVTQFAISFGGWLAVSDLRLDSVEHAALVRGDHVLDVNEGVVATVRLKQLQRLLDQVAQVLLLALRVVDFVSLVQVLGLEQVHDRKDLAVVRHQGLADGVTAQHERLQDVQSRRDDLCVARIERL